VLQSIIDWITRDWALKLTALALATLMWVTVRRDAPATWSSDIPIRIVNNDAGWVVADTPAPRTVTIRFSGPYRELLRTASELPELLVPIQEVNDSVEMHVLRPNWVRMPPGTDATSINSIQPQAVRVTFDRVATRLIPVAAPLRGEPVSGYELAGPPVIEPSVVRASGAARILARIDSLRLDPIDVRDRRGTDTLELTIDTTGTGLIISPRTVRVYVPIRSAVSDTGALPLVPQLRPILPRQQLP
jgi:YbbR domain-containing protein